MNKEYNSLSEYRDFLIDLENQWSEEIIDKAYIKAQTLSDFITYDRDLEFDSVYKIYESVIKYLDFNIYSDLDETYLFYLEDLEKQLYLKPKESDKLKYLEGKFKEIKRWLLEKERQIFVPHEYFSLLFDSDFYSTLYGQMHLRQLKKNNPSRIKIFDSNTSVKWQYILNKEYYDYYIFHRMIIYFEIVKMRLQELERDNQNTKSVNSKQTNPFPNIFKDEYGYAYGLCQFILQSAPCDLNKPKPSSMFRLFNIMQSRNHIYKQTLNTDFIKYLELTNNIYIDRLNSKSKVDETHKKVFDVLESNYQNSVT